MPAIGLAVMPQGFGDAPSRMFGVPGLHPGPHALFEIGDDLLGDVGVNVLPGCAVRGHDSSPLLSGFSERRETSKTGDKPDGYRQGNGQHESGTRMERAARCPAGAPG